MSFTKSQLAAIVASGVGRESFTHSTEGVFDVTAMRAKAIAEGRQPQSFAIEPAVVETLRGSYDWEESRVQELLQKMDPQKADPGIIVVYADASTLPIDGIHRMLAAFRLGWRNMLFWVFDESEIIRPAQGSIVLQDWGRFDIVNGQKVPRTPS